MLLLKLQLLLLFLLLSELLLDPQRSPDNVPLAPVSGVCLVLGPGVLFGICVAGIHVDYHRGVDGVFLVLEGNVGHAAEVSAADQHFARLLLKVVAKNDALCKLTNN